jgi:iron-sulfur cluster repair protein YtfE (RIC family)
VSDIPLPTQPFRDEHAELIDHVEHIRQAAAEVARVSPEERQAMVRRILGFLRGTLLPHAAAEEEVLYPEWARLVGSPDAAEPMVHDHQAIVARIDALAEVEPGDVDRLQELLYGLYALIGVHFRKEEDIQLPVLDANPEAAARVLERMGSHTHHAH